MLPGDPLSEGVAQATWGAFFKPQPPAPAGSHPVMCPRRRDACCFHQQENGLPGQVAPGLRPLHMVASVPPVQHHTERDATEDALSASTAGAAPSPERLFPSALSPAAGAAEAACSCAFLETGKNPPSRLIYSFRVE